MMRVLDSTSAPPEFLDQLQNWFELEWGESDAYEHDHSRHAPLASLLALSDSNVLIGGLAFTTYPKPDDRGSGVWINALFVAPDFRGQGIASTLVRAAEAKAKAHGIADLFVYTDVPQLYQNLGWLVLREGDENLVLTKPVAGRMG